MVDIDKAVIARLKTGGQNFEVLVDCDLALQLKEGKSIPLDDVLAASYVYTDAKKGLIASNQEMENVLGTSDVSLAAEKIIKKGEIQVTAEHRSKEREEKKRQLIEMIRMNGIDPKTNLPHPASRLELAFDEAKINVDDRRSADEQLDSVLKELRPILPIRFEKRKIAVKIPAQYAGKAYSTVAGLGKMAREEWLTDGSWACVIEIPAGLQNDAFDRINSITHGDAEIKILDSEGEK